MRFRRRRRLVTWLPNVNNPTAQGENLNLLTGAVDVDHRGTTTTAILPVVKDYDPVAASTDAFVDYTGKGYILQRIVGKLFLSLAQFSATEPARTPAAAVITAGFEILRVTDNGLPLSTAIPGSYSPLTEGNERDPWIWRRSWLLGNSYGGAQPLNTNNWDAAAGYNPNTNTFDGSVADGPHIDAKVKRRVGPEERLFLVITTWQPIDYGEAGVDNSVYYVGDIRVLATPVRASNRRNASR